jgi:crotonobetainyl-CoA:carnitine CoA-transferase CaiB-like acyl-CoA transferase
MPQVPASTALGRLRVFDLTRVRAGATCVKQPADFGADVMVKNFRPDVKQRPGIGHDALRQPNPRIGLASISGYGQDGSHADRPGFDRIAHGMGGLMMVTAEPGRGTMRAGTAVIDLAAEHETAQFSGL